MHPIRWLRRGVVWGSLGVVSGAALMTARHVLATPQPLESALAGEGHTDRRREGDIFYNVAGPSDAAPLVLLHDFYPGASNYEFRRIFSRLAASYRVYAPDWLGFGLSERPALAYTGEFYAHLLSGFLRDTIAQPAIVLAHGLAANIAVRAASDDPALFDRLVLIAPRTLAGTEPGPYLSQTLVRLAQRSSLGLVPYAALATRPALRWQLHRRAGAPDKGGASDDVLDHAFASAHQFGGHHALLALLTGELDLPMQNAFALLEPPVLVVGGELDVVQEPLTLEDLALLNPYAKLLIVPGAGHAVVEDEPAAFVEQVTDWLRTPVERHPPVPTETAWRADGAPELESLLEDTGAQSDELGATMRGGTMRGGTLDEEAILAEQFGETPGLVTPVPGLESLEGLTEQAPESAALDESLRDPLMSPTNTAAAPPEEEATAAQADVARAAPDGSEKSPDVVVDEQSDAQAGRSATAAGASSSTPADAQMRPRQAMRKSGSRDAVRTDRHETDTGDTAHAAPPHDTKGSRSSGTHAVRRRAGDPRDGRARSGPSQRKPPTGKGKPEDPSSSRPGDR